MIYEGDNLPMADTDKVFSVEFLPDSSIREQIQQNNVLSF